MLVMVLLSDTHTTAQHPDCAGPYDRSLVRDRQASNRDDSVGKRTGTVRNFCATSETIASAPVEVRLAAMALRFALYPRGKQN